VGDFIIGAIAAHHFNGTSSGFLPLNLHETLI
jgi:hypothetical protein